MARIFMQGTYAEVELTADNDDGKVIAACVEHIGEWRVIDRCNWSEKYDDWNDATEYATDHADRGVR